MSIIKYEWHPADKNWWRTLIKR